MKIVISSGHGKYISGAVGPAPWGLHEHQQAVRVVDSAAQAMRSMGIEVVTFEDTTSRTQDQNLKTIVDFHNAQGAHDLDVSIHFNANVTTNAPVGTECWYYSQQALAADIAGEIAVASGLIDRGAKKSTGLYFLKNTNEPAVLVEVCFVDSKADVELYNRNFDAICGVLAAALCGGTPAPVPPQPDDDVLFHAKGTCSWFGGPEDTGVSPSEGLAFLYKVSDAPHLFLPEQPPGTTGLARRLNPGLMYVACRWDYNRTPKTMLARPNVQALVRAGGKEILAWPADWGPHEEQTGRAADLSPALMEALELSTDDEVEVIYPAEAA